MENGRQRLTTAQAAARLGIKPETLYSYVSRGVLTSQRAEDGSGSTFDPLAVEMAAANRRRSQSMQERAGGSRPAPREPMPGMPLMVIDSPLTLLRNDELFFRGLPAVRLAQDFRFEQVARWLIASDAGTGPGPADGAVPGFVAPASLLRSVHRAVSSLSPGAGTAERLMQALVCGAAADPLKADLRPDTVRALLGPILSVLVEALASGDFRPAPAQRPLATRLWKALSDRQPTEADLRILNAALVLLLDHDLAVSTLAARAAASARAHPYAALLAALGSFDSPLHGSASLAAVRLISRTLTTGNPEQSISAELATGTGIPGFGHRIYRSRDPRAALLLRLMAGSEAYAAPLRAARRLAAVVGSRTPHMPNVDLALAVLTLGAGMNAGAGQAIFAVSRTTGWLAHILDEYGQRPLRLRPTGHYIGPLPPDGGGA